MADEFTPEDEPNWVQAETAAKDRDYPRAVAFGLLHQNAILNAIHVELRAINRSLWRAYPPPDTSDYGDMRP